MRLCPKTMLMVLEGLIFDAPAAEDADRPGRSDTIGNGRTRKSHVSGHAVVALREDVLTRVDANRATSGRFYLSVAA